jgi:hypothetical protein
MHPSSSPRHVTRIDLYAAHRQRPATRAHRAEPTSLLLRRLQEVQVDLDPVHLLHAADERVPVIFVRVQERAIALDASARIDNLVAVHVAPATLDLVLRMERKLGRSRRTVCLHEAILRTERRLRKT